MLRQRRLVRELDLPSLESSASLEVSSRVLDLVDFLSAGRRRWSFWTFNRDRPRL